jgi:eukaryotic-like serine/threonine-protein kinase
VQGVGPGTILSGRYALRWRLTQGRDLERWSAHDTTLEREVAMTVIDSDHPNRDGILDAARRAAGVEDARLIRILDVGSQDGNSFIVEEAMSGAESLAEILLQGALPAEEARRIAGETASALESAGQRGLHHLRLTPHCVLRALDGMIKVSGVAVAAAIDEIEEPDPAAASRRDAVSVVAVAYAALTTRWPLDEQVSGLEPAPRLVGGVAAPSEIAAGVPGDLDALCRMTLNEDTGPMTPGDFASQIAPWSHGPVHHAAVDPTVVMALPDSGPVAGAAEITEVTATAPVGAGVTEPTVVFSSRDLPTNVRSTRSSDAVHRADGSAPVAAPGAEERTAGAGASATQAVETALATVGAAAVVVGGKVGSFARAAADKAAARAAGKAAGSTADVGGEGMTLREAFWDHSDDAEPPMPMLPASTAQAPSRDQSKVVVMIVATFVALSLLVAYCGARGLGDGISLPNTTPRRTVAVQAPPATAPPPRTTQPGPTGPPAGRPIAILSANGFDPQGDEKEKNSQAARVYDDNPATAWTSEGYNSVDFGGLKNGVGVLLDLGQPTSVQRVTIDLGLGPVDVTAYAASRDSLEGATVIGTATAANGQVQLKAAGTMPQAQYVIVWFTKLAPDGGQFRASLSEVALS